VQDPLKFRVQKDGLVLRPRGRVADLPWRNHVRQVLGGPVGERLCQCRRAPWMRKNIVGVVARGPSHEGRGGYERGDVTTLFSLHPYCL
jgi:hypothetical protein